MRAIEIIRNLLDLLDQIDHEQDTGDKGELVSIEVPVENPMTTPVDKNHFKQIFDILSAEKAQTYDNSPAEVIASVDSVSVDAGGGWNGPKHPADLRGVTFSMYPDFQARKGDH